MLHTVFCVLLSVQGLQADAMQKLATAHAALRTQVGVMV